MTNIQVNKNTHKEGQVILLIVMMISVVATVALTLSFRSQTDVQLTKLNSESTKLREAAEAGVEIGFTIPATAPQQQQFSTHFSAIDLPGVDINRSRLIVSNPAGPSLVTPILGDNSMFTLYLSPISNLDTFAFTNTNLGQDLEIYYNDQSAACSDFILEFTIAAQSGTSFVVRPRFVATQPNNLLTSPLSTPNQSRQTSAIPAAATNMQIYQNVTGNTTTFGCWARLTSGELGAGRVLFVRILAPTGRSTRLGFHVNSGNLPVQRRTIRSEVWSIDGVLTVVEADQSYPQLPADFFVTSF